MDSDFTVKIEQLIDDLKAVCNRAGLGGDGNEYKIITQSFLYKFINDKFIHDLTELKPELKNVDDIVEALSKLSDSEYEILMARLGGGCAVLKPAHLISSLYARQNETDFYKTFNDTLNDIAVANNDTFSVHTEQGTDIQLFDKELFNAVHDESKRDETARAIINLLANNRFDFVQIFSQGFDFFSTIFEYMIKDYNANGGGVYAEYYTPHSVARVMAEILVGDEKLTSQKVLDPSAGSGMLLMNIAHKIGTDRCSVYSQDISQKSSNLLRLNLVLNNLAHSISNVVEGNTILHPAHMDKKFDFIVSNPPFKLDFSAYRDEIANNPANTNRFFAGVPSIPNKKKESMSIYLLFVQHIMHCLADKGRAAVVVPTGFITAQSGIERKIREKLIQNKWLKGVVSMPSNIFATTGTNVSVLFIDKSGNDEVVLVDASKLGEKVKEGKNQRTVLSSADEQKIIDAFHNKEAIDDFSVVLTNDKIEQKNYSFAAGQYFEIKIEHIDITPEEFQQRIDKYQENLDEMFEQSDELKQNIQDNFGKLKYE